MTEHLCYGCGGFLNYGDCLNIMAEWQPDCVDIVVTDPPFSERTHQGARTNRTKRPSEDVNERGSKLVNFDCITDSEFVTIARECLRLAKRWVIMTCDHRHAALTFDWPEFIRLGAWIKHAPMPQISGDRPGSGHESVLILHNPGKKHWNGGGKAAIWGATVLKNPTEVLQPTQKPVELLVQLLRDFTDKDELILDPFMGSGTTGVACHMTERRFIGIEKDEGRFKAAEKRIRNYALHNAFKLE